jgi:hypothetical protein
MAQPQRAKYKSIILEEGLRQMEKYKLSHDFLQQARSEIEKQRAEEEQERLCSLLSSISAQPAAVQRSGNEEVHRGDALHRKILPNSGVAVQATGADMSAASSSLQSTRHKSKPLQARRESRRSQPGVVSRGSLVIPRVSVGIEMSSRRGAKDRNHLDDTIHGRWIYKNEHTKQILCSSGAAVEKALAALAVVTESNVDLEEEERALQSQLDRLRVINEQQKAEMQRLAAVIQAAQDLTSAEKGQVIFSRSPSPTAKRKKRAVSSGVSFQSQPRDPAAASQWRGGRRRNPPLPSECPYSG